MITKVLSLRRKNTVGIRLEYLNDDKSFEAQILLSQLPLIRGVMFFLVLLI